MKSAKIKKSSWSFGQGHLVIFDLGCVIWLTIYKYIYLYIVAILTISVFDFDK